jgi:amidohydrolase
VLLIVRSSFNKPENKMKSKTLLMLGLILSGALCWQVWPGGATGANKPTRAGHSASRRAIARGLITQRRDFHMNPELSNREERTARVVAEKLRALGLDEVKTGVGKHGVVALLKGKQPGDVVAVRADMDALPIQETINVPYKSRNDGVKHACGHDVHMTVELGVAEVLSKMRDQVRGTIKFIFQPAEEGAPAGEPGGAGLMIAEGALDNPAPVGHLRLARDAQHRNRPGRLQRGWRDGLFRQVRHHPARQESARRLSARRH